MVATSPARTEPARSPPSDQPPAFRLYRVVGITAGAIVIAFLAGWLPRWRERAALAGETRALAIPAVAVVSPAPGKEAGGLLLPAAIKPGLRRRFVPGPAGT